VPTAVPRPLQDAILAWYDALGRSLPFRGTSDPYLVLVSEIMAQQTQIARVGEAWREFTATFPTIELLAAASPADVLRAWRGLGYNRRALNLWRAARVVVTDYGGRLPADVAALERLPGIGPYTARAVAAIAFGMPVGAVDTNVRRVLGRAVAGAADALAPADLQRLADASVPVDRAADWTHAVMDVGATFCRTSRPDCEPCPARQWCRYAAAAARDTLDRPVAAAPAGRPPRVARERAAPFSSTSRWLRGRILDRLRQAEGADWHELAVPIGDHDGVAVTRALELLHAEGLLERHPDSELRARLPLG
jgi:A/G-specific adenine glycosylase